MMGLGLGLGSYFSGVHAFSSPGGEPVILLLFGY